MQSFYGVYSNKAQTAPPVHTFTVQRAVIFGGLLRRDVELSNPRRIQFTTLTVGCIREK
jgi:hypothetical protein